MLQGARGGILCLEGRRRRRREKHRCCAMEAGREGGKKGGKKGGELCCSTCLPCGLQVPWGTAGLSCWTSFLPCLCSTPLCRPQSASCRPPCPPGPQGAVTLCCLLEQVQEERDNLYHKFTRAITEVQQKTGLKNLLLERKLQGLLTVLEQKEVELSEVLAASNVDPSALSLVTHKLEVLGPGQGWIWGAEPAVGCLLPLGHTGPHPAWL